MQYVIVGLAETVYLYGMPPDRDYNSSPAVAWLLPDSGPKQCRTLSLATACLGHVDRSSCKSSNNITVVMAARPLPILTWPGFDLRAIRRDETRIDYGLLPPKFFDRLIDKSKELRSRGKVAGALRDEPASAAKG